MAVLWHQKEMIRVGQRKRKKKKLEDKKLSKDRGKAFVHDVGGVTPFLASLLFVLLASSASQG